MVSYSDESPRVRTPIDEIWCRKKRSIYQHFCSKVKSISFNNEKYKTKDLHISRFKLEKCPFKQEKFHRLALIVFFCNKRGRKIDSGVVSQFADRRWTNNRIRNGLMATAKTDYSRESQRLLVKLLTIVLNYNWGGISFSTYLIYCDGRRRRLISKT